MTSAEKSVYRQRKVWKEFRAKIKKERKKDELTGQPLYKTWNLHHKLLTTDEKIYTDLSDPSKFSALNNQTHDVVHFCYDHARKNPEFMNRLKALVDEMLELNGPGPSNPFKD